MSTTTFISHFQVATFIHFHRKYTVQYRTGYNFQVIHNFHFWISTNTKQMTYTISHKEKWYYSANMNLSLLYFHDFVLAYTIRAPFNSKSTVQLFNLTHWLWYGCTMTFALYRTIVLWKFQRTYSVNYFVPTPILIFRALSIKNIKLIILFSHLSGINSKFKFARQLVQLTERHHESAVINCVHGQNAFLLNRVTGIYPKFTLTYPKIYLHWSYAHLHLGQIYEKKSKTLCGCIGCILITTQTDVPMNNTLIDMVILTKFNFFS